MSPSKMTTLVDHANTMLLNLRFPPLPKSKTDEIVVVDAKGGAHCSTTGLTLARVANQTSAEVFDMAYRFHELGDDGSADDLMWTALVGPNLAKHKKNEVKMDERHTNARAKALATLEKRRAAAGK